ncbi:histidine kinase, partial [Streptomyces sp. McG8]|nr:histidine kinase [Streptomyces sp. McG8]
MEIDEGTLGRPATAPCRARLIHAIPGLFAYAGGALAVGALAAWLISRRVQRQTRDLALSLIHS